MNFIYQCGCVCVDRSICLSIICVGVSPDIYIYILLMYVCVYMNVCLSVVLQKCVYNYAACLLGVDPLVRRVTLYVPSVSAGLRVANLLTCSLISSNIDCRQQTFASDRCKVVEVRTQSTVNIRPALNNYNAKGRVYYILLVTVRRGSNQSVQRNMFT